MRIRKRVLREPLTFESFGVQVQLTLGDQSLETAIEPILPPVRTVCEPTDGAARFALRELDEGTYEVTIGDEPWLEHQALDVALGMLDAEIRKFIATTATDWVFVHAGVVAHDGRALVIPGESFSGKTTLVAALVEAGATYCSDEYAVLDQDGRVHPYPRRLSLRDRYGQPLREHHVNELGGVAMQTSVALSTVIVTRYRPGATWQPEPLTTGAGLLALLANTVPARIRPGECMAVLKRALAGADAWQSDRDEAGPVAVSLFEALRSGSRLRMDGLPSRYESSS